MGPGVKALLLLGGAGFVAGVMNAVAGGGSFVTFPALVAAGLPSVGANASSTVALFPGQLTSAYAYRREIRSFQGLSMRVLVPLSLVGGICGALLDCHSNWAAAHHLMRQSGAAAPPCTVTADFHVFLRHPTPMDVPLKLKARVIESRDDRAVVEASLEADGKVTATCRGTFVAVKPGHPAYHRW